MDAGGPVHDGETAMDESCFKEVTIEVHEPSTIFEAKDGAYGK